MRLQSGGSVRHVVIPVSSTIHTDANEECFENAKRMPSIVKALMMYANDRDDWNWLTKAAAQHASSEEMTWLQNVLRKPSSSSPKSSFTSVELRLIQQIGSPLMQTLIRCGNRGRRTPPWCALQWATHRNWYDYFVPVNVQQQLEAQRKPRCQIYRWDGWSRRTFELRVQEVGTTAASAATLDSICFRISVMAELRSDCCRHMVLRWLPSDCAKSVHSCRSCHKSGYGGSGDDVFDNMAAAATACRSWGPFQINTGATYRNTCDTLTVWRQEEAQKTFVHELMHALAYDFNDPPNGIVDDWTRRHFAVAPGTSVLFFEAYVETWATILNTYFIAAIEHHASPESTKAKVVQDMLALERRFVMWQVAKIVIQSGFESFEDFFTSSSSSSSTSSVSPGPYFRQATSVLSYFVLRSAHLWNIKWFVDTFAEPPFTTNGKGRTEFFVEWLEHLRSIFALESYKQTINEMISLQREDQTSPTYYPDNNILYTTMRMTLFEKD